MKRFVYLLVGAIAFVAALAMNTLLQDDPLEQPTSVTESNLEELGSKPLSAEIDPGDSRTAATPAVAAGTVRANGADDWRARDEREVAEEISANRARYGDERTLPATSNAATAQLFELVPELASDESATDDILAVLEIIEEQGITGQVPEAGASEQIPE